MDKKAIIGLALLAMFVAAGAFVFLKKDGSKQDVMTEEGASGGVKNIRLVLLEGTDDMNFIIDFARDNGIFSQNGVEVETILAERQPYQILMAGEADVSLGSLLTTLSIYMSEAEPRLLATPIKSFDTVFISRFPKEESANIKKAVIARVGSGSHFSADAALRELGVDVDNVELIAVSGEGPRARLLDSGEADFTSLRSEQSLTELGIEDKYMVYYLEDLVRGNESARDIITSERAIREKGEELRLFVLSFYQTLEFLSENPQEAKSYLQAKYGFDEKRADNFYSRFEKAREGVSFVPDTSQWGNMIERVKKLVDPTNPDKDINKFVFDEYAREAVNGGGK